MRTCAFNVGLIKRKYSTNLQFTTEPEAAAIYCMKKNLNEQALAKPGVLFLKYAYGCYGYDMWKKWVYGDPIDRRTPEGFIVKFKCLARHGTKMNVDQEVTIIRVPIFEDQENMITKIYYTRSMMRNTVMILA
ncbi:hypothetical protein RclHR1_01240002 [Rhizophagus clarus]|uniref:Uncharacterized protein n=1 Tax=Rhizophagus clarus TaxID=94130 RepID=A0A2Z6QME5_9GLOM|nr:hypothetical protein RclHR1_01240002 [Rhizophagus clarus]